MTNALPTPEQPEYESVGYDDLVAGEEIQVWVCIENDDWGWEGRHVVAVKPDHVVFREGDFHYTVVRGTGRSRRMRRKVRHPGDEKVSTPEQPHARVVFERVRADEVQAGQNIVRALDSTAGVTDVDRRLRGRVVLRFLEALPILLAADAPVFRVAEQVSGSEPSEQQDRAAMAAAMDAIRTDCDHFQDGWEAHREWQHGLSASPVAAERPRLVDDGDRTVKIAYCSQHGLHGERDTCFECGAPTVVVPMRRLRHSEHEGSSYQSIRGVRWRCSCGETWSDSQPMHAHVSYFAALAAGALPVPAAEATGDNDA